MHWYEDKALRDTEPFINGVSYGVHRAVKIYYSPSVINWLLRKNPDEAIPDGAMILFGPFEDIKIVTDPMNNSLGIKPKHDPYIKSSRMCGNHTINLPLMDNPTLNPGKPHLEQLTYLDLRA